MFEEEKTVVKAWFSMLTGSQEDVWGGFDAVLHPDMTWTVLGNSPVSGVHKGLEAINRDFFDRCWETGDGRGSGTQGLDDEYGLQLTMTNFAALEDGRILLSCTSDAKGMNGLPYNNNYCWLITVENGKIVDLYEWCDTVQFETVMFDKKLVPAEDL